MALILLKIDNYCLLSPQRFANMSKNKIIYRSDIFLLVGVLLIYGCSSLNKKNAVDWNNMRYAKIGCEKDDKGECKSVVDNEGANSHSHGHGKR